MRKLIYLSFIVILSCVSEQEQKAGSEIASILKAENVSISKGMERSTNDEAIDYVGVEITNPKVLEEGTTYPEAMLSISALILYNNLDEETKKEKNGIKVKMTSSAQKGEPEFTRLIMFTDLEKVKTSINTLEKFTYNLTNNQYLDAYDYFGEAVTKEFPKDSLINLLTVVSIDNGAIKGFQVKDFLITKASSEGTKTPVIAIKGMLQKDTIGHDVEFYVNDKQKIVGFKF